MDMRKSTFNEEPELVVCEGAQVRVNFDVEEVTVTASDEDGNEATTAYEAYVVRVAHPVTRDRVIDAIVSAAYPSDVMQAIVNNHLLDETDEDHEAEFAAMQEWRSKAKEVATEVIEALS